VDAAKDYAQSLFAEGRGAITRELGDDNAVLAVIEWLWQRQK
jgi:farnesyl diphosphate synthase